MNFNIKTPQNENIYIWTLPNRIFHWLLATGFAAAYILGDYIQPAID
jgi:cytochrome b561